MGFNAKALSCRGAIILAGGLVAAMPSWGGPALAVATYIKATGREKKKPSREASRRLINMRFLCSWPAPYLDFICDVSYFLSIH